MMISGRKTKRRKVIQKRKDVRVYLRKEGPLYKQRRDEGREQVYH